MLTIISIECYFLTMSKYKYNKNKNIYICNKNIEQQIIQPKHFYNL